MKMIQLPQLGVENPLVRACAPVDLTLLLPALCHQPAVALCVCVHPALIHHSHTPYALHHFLQSDLGNKTRAGGSESGVHKAPLWKANKQMQMEGYEHGGEAGFRVASAPPPSDPHRLGQTMLPPSDIEATSRVAKRMARSRQARASESHVASWQ